MTPPSAVVQGPVDPTGGSIVRGTAFLPPECATCGGRAVPAEGSLEPEAFFVGEAPGPDEEKLGRPFVGRAGRVLRKALLESGWNEDRIWITNVVKSFPFDVVAEKRKIRKPTSAEIRNCLPHLAREIQELEPTLVVGLGRTAVEALLGRRVGTLASLRGRVLSARQELGGVPIFITIHPSALSYGKLRGQRDGLLADLRAARDELGKARTPR